jgi:hypothetical protein
MEDSSMTNRFRRVLILVSMGGMTFGWGLAAWGCHPFAENQPYVNFLSGIGNEAVAVGVDAALANFPANVNNWFNDPVTGLYQDIWTGYVQHSFAQDPTYNTLLVQ